MKLNQKYGQWALIAGASEGIGAAFSSYLAAEGFDLILIARGKEKLDQFAASLKEKHSINISCLYIDLASANAFTEIQDAIRGKEMGLFVYNAALSYIGPFEKNTMLEHEQLAQVNMILPMKLSQLIGGNMLNRGRGAVVLMASLAGFQGSGFLSAYGASKAFNRVLAEGLWYEWKERGVDVLACCAGATSTPNFIKTKPGKTSLFAPKVQSPEEVVDECMKRIGKDASFISGKGNRIASFFMQKILPRKMAITIMGDTTRKMYRL